MLVNKLKKSILICIYERIKCMKYEITYYQRLFENTPALQKRLRGQDTQNRLAKSS